MFQGLIDTIPSDNNTRGHTFSLDLDWLSCGEQWQSLRLLIWHIQSSKLCPAGADSMRGDQRQNKQVTPFFKIWIGCLVVNDDKVFICLYDMSEVVCSALQVPTTWEVTNDKQFQFAHTFSQDLDWLPYDNNDQGFICWYDTEYKKLLLCPSCTVYLALVLPSSWEYNTDKQWQFI